MNLLAPGRTTSGAGQVVPSGEEQIEQRNQRSADADCNKGVVGSDVALWIEVDQGFTGFAGHFGCLRQGGKFEGEPGHIACVLFAAR